MPANLLLQFDGVITANPGGKAACGYVLSNGKRILGDGSKFIGEGKGLTINIAEAWGLLVGLRAAMSIIRVRTDLQNGILRVEGDSQVVINAVNRGGRTTNPELTRILKECVACIKRLGDVRLSWIPGSANGWADAKSRSYDCFSFKNSYRSRPDFVIKSKWRSNCVACSSKIQVGDEVTKCRGKWVHAGCWDELH